VRNNIHFDCPMDRYTTFRVGGKAEALCFLRELGELQDAVSFLTGEKIPYLVVGKGSNLLVKDGGLEGVVMMLQADLAAVSGDAGDDRIVLAGGGLGIMELLTYCSGKGLAGLEFLAGIPGTIGGAVAMNAGAWNQDVGGRVEGIEVVTGEGEETRMDRVDLGFSYRTCAIPEGSVIVGIRFKLDRERPEDVAAGVARNLKKRMGSQPLGYPSAGSVFKNPPEDHAGRLIERAGLKGKRIGGAMISPEHANFIVNTGGARAADILALMELARSRVKEQTGVDLEPEIRIVGR
jgi:UDP-N-acetylmuramate dehydrogenase